MVGAEHLPQQVAGDHRGERRGVGGDLEGQCRGQRQGPGTPASASSAPNTRPDRHHSRAWLIPAMRGRNQLAAPSGTMPRAANTKPALALSAMMRMSIGSVMEMPTATAGPLVAAM